MNSQKQVILGNYFYEWGESVEDCDNVFMGVSNWKRKPTSSVWLSEFIEKTNDNARIMSKEVDLKCLIFSISYTIESIQWKNLDFISRNKTIVSKVE